MLRRLLPLLTLVVMFAMMAQSQPALADEAAKTEEKPAATEAHATRVVVMNTDPNQKFYYYGLLILIFFSAINAVCLILLRSDIQSLRSGSNAAGS